MRRNAFTLIELLVVIGIVALIVAILLPALAGAVNASRLSTCGARLHQLGLGVISYSMDHKGKIPLGPDDAHLFFGVSRQEVASTYAWVGTSGSLEGAGVLMDHYLPSPESLFCPADTTNDPFKELERIKAHGAQDGFSSYLYRQLDQTESALLADLGFNDAGEDARALMLDMNSLGSLHPTLFRTNHGGIMVNILFIDGHVRGVANQDDALTMDQASADATFFNPSITQKRLDQIMVNADYAENGMPGDAPQLP